MTTLKGSTSDHRPELLALYVECWDNLLRIWSELSTVGKFVRFVDIRGLPIWEGKANERAMQERYEVNRELPTVLAKWKDWLEPKYDFLRTVFPQALKPMKQQPFIMHKEKPKGMIARPGVGGLGT